MPYSNLRIADGAATAQPARALDGQPLAAERAFYGDHPWSLNPLCTAADISRHLAEELSRVGTQTAWQRDEAMTNIFLLAGALLTAAEDALHGPVLRVPHRIGRLPGTRRGFRALSGVLAMSRTREM